MNNPPTIGKEIRTDIKEKIKLFIQENFLIIAGSNIFDDNDSFMGRGIIDSTGVLELVSFIEVAFKIKVEDIELTPDNLDSLNKITTYITGKKINAG